MSLITHDGKIVSAGGKGLTFDSLIALANATTGEDDKTLAAAVASLIEGYGGAPEPTLLCTLAQDMSYRDLLDNFPIPIPDGFGAGACFAYHVGGHIAASGTKTPLALAFLIDGTTRLKMYYKTASGLVAPSGETITSRIWPDSYNNTNYFGISDGKITRGALNTDYGTFAAGNKVYYLWMPLDPREGDDA